MRFFEEIHDEREERHREQIAKLQERLDLAISQRDEYKQRLDTISLITQGRYGYDVSE